MVEVLRFTLLYSCMCFTVLHLYIVFNTEKVQISAGLCLQPNEPQKQFLDVAVVPLRPLPPAELPPCSETASEANLRWELEPERKEI